MLVRMRFGTEVHSQAQNLDLAFYFSICKFGKTRKNRPDEIQARRIPESDLPMKPGPENPIPETHTRNSDPR